LSAIAKVKMNSRMNTQAVTIGPATASSITLRTRKPKIVYLYQAGLFPKKDLNMSYNYRDLSVIGLAINFGTKVNFYNIYS